MKHSKFNKIKKKYKIPINRTQKTQKTQKTISLKKLNCSPKPKQLKNSYSCYSDSVLLKLKTYWNMRHPSLKITSNNPREIHQKLSYLMRETCSNEACWLKQTLQLGMSNRYLDESFAPSQPKEWEKNPNEWLSSLDIMKVMKQYEKAYPCFEFIGPSPIDFDTKIYDSKCVWEELCNFNIENQIKKGKTKIGIIFNTDPHNKPGQHWISLFINIRKKLIFFFDSNGTEPPREINNLVSRIIKQGFSMKPPIKFKFDSNEGIEHQYGNTECGIYSLYFIINLLEDKMTTNYLKTHKLNDKYIERFRNIYFNSTI